MTLGFVQLSNAWQFKNWCCQIQVWCTLRCVTLKNIKSLDVVKYKYDVQVQF